MSKVGGVTCDVLASGFVEGIVWQQLTEGHINVNLPANSPGRVDVQLQVLDKVKTVSLVALGGGYYYYYDTPVTPPGTIDIAYVWQENFEGGVPVWFSQNNAGGGYIYCNNLDNPYFPPSNPAITTTPSGTAMLVFEGGAMNPGDFCIITIGPFTNTLQAPESIMFKYVQDAMNIGFSDCIEVYCGMTNDFGTAEYMGQANRDQEDAGAFTWVDFRRQLMYIGDNYIFFKFISGGGSCIYMDDLALGHIVGTPTVSNLGFDVTRTYQGVNYDDPDIYTMKLDTSKLVNLTALVLSDVPLNITPWPIWNQNTPFGLAHNSAQVTWEPCSGLVREIQTVYFGEYYYASVVDLTTMEVLATAYMAQPNTISMVMYKPNGYGIPITDGYFLVSCDDIDVMPTIGMVLLGTNDSSIPTFDNYQHISPANTIDTTHVLIEMHNQANATYEQDPNQYYSVMKPNEGSWNFRLAWGTKTGIDITYSNVVDIIIY